jgi:hypothetical protein
VINRRSLTNALKARKVSEWTVVERGQEIAIADEAQPLRRRDLRRLFTVVVHHDVTRGRGTAKLEIASLHGEALDIVDQAIDLAEAAVGPSWQSTPPAAPAKVALLDPQLERADLAEVAAELLAALPRPAGATVTSSIEVLREFVTVHASSGFHTGRGRRPQPRGHARGAQARRSRARTGTRRCRARPRAARHGDGTHARAVRHRPAQ